MSGSPATVTVFSIVSDPEFGEECQFIDDCLQKRLWHEATEAILELTQKPSIRNSGAVYRIFTEVLGQPVQNINPLSYARLAAGAALQAPSKDDANALLSAAAEKVKDEAEAVVFVRLQSAQLALENGDDTACKQTVTECEESLGALSCAGSDVVLAQLHRVRAAMAKASSDASTFYKQSLLYLAYQGAQSLPPDVQASIAFDIALAALCSNEIYQFGELLLHPIMPILEGRKEHWLLALVKAFNAGDISAFEKAKSTHSREFAEQPALSNNDTILGEKIRIFALLELLRDRGASSRNVAVADIAKRCELPEDQVEFVLMRALSLGLCAGNIDQVNQAFDCKSVQPRVLEHESVGRLAEQISAWSDKVQQVAHVLQDCAPELVTASS